MLAKFAILITAVAASSVLAAPALERRQTGYITLCSEKMMLDGCQDLGIQTGQCRKWPSPLCAGRRGMLTYSATGELPDGIRDNLSSFDTYGYRCEFYT